LLQSAAVLFDRWKSGLALHLTRGSTISSDQGYTWSLLPRTTKFISLTRLGLFSVDFPNVPLRSRSLYG